MKKKVRKQIEEIIKKQYLTDWEFIVEVLAPEFEEEDFDIDEVVTMIMQEKLRREIDNSKYPIV